MDVVANHELTVEGGARRGRQLRSVIQVEETRSAAVELLVDMVLDTEYAADPSARYNVLKQRLLNTTAMSAAIVEQGTTLEATQILSGTLYSVTVGDVTVYSQTTDGDGGDNSGAADATGIIVGSVVGASVAVALFAWYRLAFNKTEKAVAMKVHPQQATPPAAPAGHGSGAGDSKIVTGAVISNSTADAANNNVSHADVAKTFLA